MAKLINKWEEMEKCGRFCYIFVTIKPKSVVGRNNRNIRMQGRRQGQAHIAGAFEEADGCIAPGWVCPEAFGFSALP